ncbi:MAG: glycoside hydrolase [Rudanella sp.]|nr:glycoside hydrolase [Rudanella sp.]
MKTPQFLRLLALLSLSVLLISPESLAQQPVFETIATVFEPGKEYATTRIPALVCSKKGTLLAFTEARVQNTGDWADMDILLRRSTDGGKNWLPVQVFAARRPKQPTSNCTPIVDADGKTIHVLYQRNYANCFYTKSTDEGATWSEPADITYVFEKFRPEYNWKVLAPGPGHAIQLSQGQHKGRLVVPVWLCEPNPTVKYGDHRPSCIATVFSDDGGKTWQRGTIVANNGDRIGGDTLVNPSEHIAVELSDGRVMLNIRSESAPHRRLVAYSPDGATAWTKPVFDDELFDPVCMASLIRLPKAGKEKPALLFVNPDSQTDPSMLNPKVNFRKRQNLTAKLSTDDGQTWSVKKVLDPGNAGYSDVAVGPDGLVYCLYETNAGAAEGWRYHVVLKRFNRAWLTDNTQTPTK